MRTRYSVLIVDDDIDLRDSIEEALVDEGYDVAVASNGREALGLMREHGLRPDLILLDMMMPDMDGWAFRAEQQSLPGLSSIPVVVFTAHNAPRDLARQLDAVGYLKKPLHLDELLALVAEVRHGRP